MVDIEISNEILSRCPAYKVALVSAHIVNSGYSTLLWEEISKIVSQYRSSYSVETIKKLKPIYDTREAYKKCGKEPSRYRPAAEALCRRVLKGNDLYNVNTAVDLVNVVSIVTGFSIGAFDAAKISGDKITYGIGRSGEPYEGIGRGPLNIEGLPVWRDALGGFGTPTSDHERTKLEVESSQLLVLINSYGGLYGLDEAVGKLIELLIKYACASNISSEIR
jgi:DNA/RNA-binding domain of Phe-tRNA-synthetase-like protein